MARRLLARRTAWERWINDPVISGMRGLARERGTPAWLVGGMVRDTLLGRATHDYDLVVAGDAAPIAAELAHRLSARHVQLGAGDDRIDRVVFPGGAEADIWGLRAASLTDDILRRDFTINALFVDLESGRWIDRVGGRADLARGVLRRISVRSLREDPLRLLRALRLAAEIPVLRIEAGTRREMRALAHRLADAAPERRGVELSRLLATPASATALALAQRLGLVRPLFAEAEHAPARLPLATLARLDAMRPRRRAGTAGWLHADLLLAKWAALASAFRTLGDARLALSRLALGQRLAERAVDLAAALHRLDDWRRRPASDARLLLLLRDAGSDVAALQRLAAAALHGESGALALTRRLARLARLHGERLAAPPRWLSGDEAMTELGLPPGPALGRLLAALSDATATGAVASREEAVAFLRRRGRRAGALVRPLSSR